MYLVHEKKEQSGKWEVAWMWLPHFLASDRALHKHVGGKMTETFKGETFEAPVPAALLKRMHDQAIRFILEKYPIPGLRQYLEATIHVQPEEAPEESA